MSKLTILDFTHHDLWLSPEGLCYEGDAHAVQAECIMKELYGIELNPFGINSAEEALIDRGWVKLTTSLMYDYFYIDKMYNNLTEEQQSVYDEWKNYHNK